MAPRRLRMNTQKDMWYDHIGLIYAHNNDTILGSIINTIGRAFVISFYYYYLKKSPKNIHFNLL